VLPVGALAAGAVAFAARAVGDPEPVPARVATAYTSERHFRIGGEAMAAWAPLSGFFAARDGFVRTHANYPHHRERLCAALGIAASPDELRERVAGLAALEVEETVTAAGGIAVAVRSEAEWAAHPHGSRVGSLPLLVEQRRSDGAARSVAGARVLDLTRVIAGPVATRYLAAYGADVLRIDPPDFPEVPALLPEVTPGKRCAGLDLRADRDAFLRLVRQAHVLVCGLRSGALDRLGLSVAELRSIHPGLITARLNAYGWSGPWTDRRGFDSLVQMSCGIAYLDEDTPPSPLPVQALDHATGYALAGWIGRSLAEQLLSGRPSDIRTSLVATAAALTDRARPAAGPGEIDWPDTLFETTGTAWGPVRRVRVPGAIEGVTPRWAVDAGPLGRHRASFG
jgi:hypothetical protein